MVNPYITTVPYTCGTLLYCTSMAACLEIQYKELCKVNGLWQGDEFVACQNQLLQRGAAAQPCKKNTSKKKHRENADNFPKNVKEFLDVQKFS